MKVDEGLRVETSLPQTYTDQNLECVQCQPRYVLYIVP